MMQFYMNYRFENLDKKLINAITVLLKILLLTAFIAVIVYMIIAIYNSVLYYKGSGENILYTFIDIIVENSLLAVVIFEIYESVSDFFDGTGKTVQYILNAAISFSAREILLIIFQAKFSSAIEFNEIISISVLIVALSFSSFIISRQNIKKTQ